MNFTKVVLFTDKDGKAKFREEPIALNEGTPQAALSRVFSCGGYQLRHSPVTVLNELSHERELYYDRDA